MKDAKKQLPSFRSKLVLLAVGTTTGFIVFCTVFLLLIIYNVLSDYILRDLDFALEETSGNFSVKLQILEDTLLKIRGDAVLMSALAGGGLKAESTDDSPTQTALKNVTDIYSDKNTSALSAPFLEAVYLFDSSKNGVCNSVSYHDELYETRLKNDAEYKKLCADFRAMNTDVAVIPGDGRLNCAYRLYDGGFNDRATVIFAVNSGAVEQIMSKPAEYRDAFWFIFDRAGKIVQRGGEVALTEPEIRELSETERTGPLGFKANGVTYRVLTEPIAMGVGAVIGVPSNQLFMLLFDSIKYYIYLLLAALILIGALIFIIIMRISRPIQEIAAKLQLVAEEKFDTKLPEYSSREFSTVSSAFNTMTDTINHLITDVYEKKLLVMDSEMKFLQSQVNPHFMYNVLNTIALKAQLDGNDEVYAMAASFAGLMQARLNHNGDEKITLEQELQYVRFYLELQRFRFEDKLHYRITPCDDELLLCRIPKLTIELIAENAVLHGIESKPTQGNVYIDVYRVESGVEITIEDDGVGFDGDGYIPLPLPQSSDAGGEHNHIALNNAYKLIKHFYGDDYGIVIQSRKGVGTRVTINIPVDRG